MPRNGSGVYSADWVNASPNTTIESAKQNAMIADLVADANSARPITAGGTGATTASGARAALAVPGLADANAFTADQTVTSTDAAAAAGPLVTLYRNSASPAANDVLGRVGFDGEDSAGNTQEYGSIEAVIIDPTSTSEDGKLDFYAPVAGTRTKVVSVGPNLDLGAVGQIKFPATANPSANVNTLDDYEENDTTPTVTSTSGAFTTVSCSLLCTKVGRLVTFNGIITITDAGTAAGNINVPLPYTAAQAGGGGGSELSATGFALAVGIIASTAQIVIAKYDGLTIIGSGRILRFAGSFIPS